MDAKRKYSRKLYANKQLVSGELWRSFFEYYIRIYDYFPKDWMHERISRESGKLGKSEQNATHSTSEIVRELCL